jgi:hypothetical protein
MTNQAAPLRQVYAYYFGWHTPESWKDGRLMDHPKPLYNSQDDSTLDRHIKQAKDTGIDAFIMSWFGPKNNNLTHVVFNMLLDRAKLNGFAVGAALDMVDGGFNATPAEVIESLQYLLNDRANHPGYLRFNNKPVVYFWNQGRFSLDQWTQIRAQVDPNRNSIWVMEGTDTTLLKVFDGLYLFNVAWSSNFLSTASTWGSKMRAAGGWFYTPTAMPGWDESRLEGRTNPTTPKARANGAFLTNSWRGAVDSGSGIIMIVSWNEFLENSYIEPSETYGTQAIDTLKSLIFAWRNPTVKPAVQPTTTTSGTTQYVTVINTDTLRVRQGPSTSTTQISSVKQGEKFKVLSKSGEWYQITANGVTGWVFSGYLSVTNQ